MNLKRIILSAFVFASFVSAASAQPTSGDLRYSFSAQGTLRAQVVLDEAPGSTLCRVTPSIRWGRGANVSEVKALNTYLVGGNSKVIVLRALRMPRLRGGAQVMNMQFAIECGESEFVTNVFARFIDCAQQLRFSRKTWEARLRSVLRRLR